MTSTIILLFVVFL